MKDLDALEQHLLSLGREELWLMSELDRIAEHGRELAKRGDVTGANAIWELHDRLRLRLKELLVSIKDVENELYRARRSS